MSLVITEVSASPPSSPHREAQPLADAGTKSLSITQTFQAIPRKLYKRTGVDEAWLRGQVPAHLIQPGSFWRLRVDQFPSVRISETAHNDYYGVSIADSCFEDLLDLGFPICFENWESFHRHLEGASRDIRCQFFKLCASLAPSLDSRTNKLWSKHFRTLRTAKERWKAEHANQLVLLYQLFECAAGGQCMDVSYRRQFDSGKRSVNSNLADLRRLLHSHCTDEQSFDELNAEDRITIYAPIGFPSMVYDTLPASLINILPMETVNEAQLLIWKTKSDKPWIKEPTSCLSMLLYYCATKPNSRDTCRDWMASSEGQEKYFQVVHILNKQPNPEELVISLTALCLFEELLTRDTGHEHQSWVTSLPSSMSKLCRAEHITVNMSKPRPSLWREIGSSLVKACLPRRSGDELRCYMDILGWLATVTPEMQQANTALEMHWDNVLESSIMMASDRPRSVPMQRSG